LFIKRDREQALKEACPIFEHGLDFMRKRRAPEQKNAGKISPHYLYHTNA
jgi:hypothetical protein